MSYITHTQQKCNLPNQQPSTPSAGTQNHLPKIAFVYENSCQNKKESQDEKNSKLKNDNIDSRGQGNKDTEKRNVNLCSTPKKIENKENMFLNVPNKGNTYHSTRYEHQNNVNLHKNNQTLSKRPNSPLNCKLPPHSPNKSSKKLPQKCPSFFNQKEKEIVQNENEEIFETLCKCGKNISHKVINTSEKCCSTCGVAKMIQGFELEPYSPVNLRKSEIYLSELGVSTLSKGENIKNLSEFLKDLKEEKTILEKNFKESSLSSENNIRSFYKEKKLELKSHYEKIKLAIKESIEEDLKEIESLEKEKLHEWQNSLLNLETDMKKLSKILAEVSSLEKIESESKISKEIFDEYEQIVSRNKREISNRTSKVEYEADTLAISGVSNVPSNASFMSSTLLKNLNPHGHEMYKSSIYRMISSKIATPRTSELCTESRIETVKKENLVEKSESRQNNPKLQNSNNLLFSFQKK